MRATNDDGGGGSQESSPPTSVTEARANIDAALVCLAIQYADVTRRPAVPVPVAHAVKDLDAAIDVAAFVPRSSTSSTSTPDVLGGLYNARWEGTTLTWQPVSASSGARKTPSSQASSTSPKTTKTTSSHDASGGNRKAKGEARRGVCRHFPLGLGRQAPPGPAAPGLRFVGAQVAGRGL